MSLRQAVASRVLPRAPIALIAIAVAAALVGASVAVIRAANPTISAQARFALRSEPLAAAVSHGAFAPDTSVTRSPLAAKPRQRTTVAPAQPAPATAAADESRDQRLAEVPAALVTVQPAAFSSASAAPLKAVVIVGPSGASETSANLAQAEEFAARAESYRMDVRRVFYPHATWKRLLANIDGANLVVYFGHGNGWPSPYPPFQEHSKDGFGLDSRDGGGPDDVTYYGADYIRRSVSLAPNAVVILSHLCYSAGNAEPGMPIPTLDIASQRVDNTASGFLAAGAAAVFAYATGSITPILDGLFGAANDTIDQIFMAGGRHSRPYYGYTGWNDAYVASVRTNGAQSHLDPGRDAGFLRAVTGILSMTAADWRAAAG
jgi:hypothetical protein